MRWLVCVVLLAGQLGCLGFFDEPQSLETKTNNPPWIDETTMDPDTNLVAIDKTGNPGGSTTFSLKKALDFDQGDVLFGWWLLDRRPGTENPLRCGKAQDPSPKGFSPFELRDVNFSCTINHSRTELAIDKSVVLELFVLDRDVPVEDVNKAQPGWPRDGNHFTSVKWILQVQ